MRSTTITLTILSLFSLAMAVPNRLNVERAVTITPSTNKKVIVVGKTKPSPYVPSQANEGKYSCGDGVSTCSVDPSSGYLTPLTCDHLYFMNFKKCSSCGYGKGSPYDNKVTACTTCPNKLASSCVILGPDVTCRSGSYLAKGRTCTTCQPGFSTANDNKSPTCSDCGITALTCDQSTTPPTPKTCVSSYKILVVNGVNTCARTYIA